MIIFYLMQKVLADITHGDNGLWFLTNLESTPVLDLTRPDEFFASMPYTITSPPVTRRFSPVMKSE